MYSIVFWADARKQKKLKTSLNVVLAEFQLCLDLVNLLVFKAGMFKSVCREVYLGVVQTELAYASKKASLQDHFDVKAVLHALKIFRWVFHSHRLALFVLDVVLVDDAEQLAAYAKFLIRRHDKNLRDGDPILGTLVILLERSPIGDQFVIHVDEKVVPIWVNVDKRCALNVELKQGLQMAIDLFEVRVLSGNLVYLEHFGCRLRTLTVKSDTTFRSVGTLKLVKNTERLLLGDLPAELVYELAKRFEFFGLLAHDLNELFAIKYKT